MKNIVSGTGELNQEQLTAALSCYGKILELLKNCVVVSFSENIFERDKETLDLNAFDLLLKDSIHKRMKERNTMPFFQKKIISVFQDVLAAGETEGDKKITFEKLKNIEKGLLRLISEGKKELEDLSLEKTKRIGKDINFSLMSTFMIFYSFVKDVHRGPSRPFVLTIDSIAFFFVFFALFSSSGFSLKKKSDDRSTLLVSSNVVNPKGTNALGGNLASLFVLPDSSVVEKKDSLEEKNLFSRERDVIRPLKVDSSDWLTPLKKEFHYLCSLEHEGGLISQGMVDNWLDGMVLSHFPHLSEELKTKMRDEFKRMCEDYNEEVKK